MDLAPDGVAEAAAGGPALLGVDPGQVPGQFLVPGRAADHQAQQARLAHRDGEVRARAVVRADQRGRADPPPELTVLGHQPAAAGQHQAGAAAPDRAHLALGQPAQRVQREHVEFLPQRAGQLLAPAEHVHRLGDQGGRDVVPGGEPQAHVRVPEQPAHRGQRVVRRPVLVQQPGQHGGREPAALAGAAVCPGVHPFGVNADQPRPAGPGGVVRPGPVPPGQPAALARTWPPARRVRAARFVPVGLAVPGRRGCGDPAVEQRRAPGPPAAAPGRQLAAGDGQLDRGGARVVGGALVRAHY